MANDEIGVLADSFRTMGKALRDREDALKAAQAALVQSEKMAAFGQIGAVLLTKSKIH